LENKNSISNQKPPPHAALDHSIRTERAHHKGGKGRRGIMVIWVQKKDKTGVKLVEEQGERGEGFMTTRSCLKKRPRMNWEGDFRRKKKHILIRKGGNTQESRKRGVGREHRWFKPEVSNVPSGKNGENKREKTIATHFIPTNGYTDRGGGSGRVSERLWGGCFAGVKKRHTNQKK